MPDAIRVRDDDEFRVGEQQVWGSSAFPPMDTWCRKHECSRSICVTLNHEGCMTPAGRPFTEEDFDTCLV